MKRTAALMLLLLSACGGSVDPQEAEIECTKHSADGRPMVTCPN